MFKTTKATTTPVFFLSALSAVIMSAPPVTAAPGKLEKVYVSATRSETAQMPLATQIKIITEEDIRISGAKLVAEVLRTQAGVQLTDSDGSGARSVTASMRGLSGANNVLVLVDGRKLNNPSLAAPALNTVSLKDVERIEIVQGSAGVLYGDQAVGGVINIITRRAKAGNIDGTLNATAGSNHLEDYSGSVSQGFTNGLSYFASAQKRDADNYRDNNQTHYENLLVNIAYNAERGFIFAEGQRVIDDLRLPGMLTDEEVIQNRRATNSPNDFSDQDTDVWRLGLGLNVTEQWLLQAEYSDRNEEGIYFYDNYFGGTALPTENSVRVKSFTPRVIGEYSLDRGTAIATLGYDHIDSTYESNNVWAPVNADQQQRSIYAHLVYPLSTKVTGNIGVRRSDVDDKNYLAAINQEDALTASEVGLNFQMTREWRLFGRFAESFRFGNADENNLVSPGVTFLKPQTGESIEFGTAWQGADAQVSYSVYAMSLDDEIVYDAIQFANINLPDSERKGFMLEVSTRLSEEIAFNFNYTFTDAEIVEGTYEGKNVPLVAEHSGSVTVLFTPLDDLNFSLESIYTGSRFKGDDEANSQPELAALTVFNLAVTYNFNNVELSGRINNITNELYAGYHAVWGQYPQPERNYQAGVTYRF